MLLRKIILALALALASAGAFAQPSKPLLNLLHYDYLKTFRFGFTLGANVFDFTTVNTLRPIIFEDGTPPIVARADVVTMRPGFSINAIVDYRISNVFNLRALPGICFGSRDLNFYDDELPGNALIYSMPIASNYIEVPVQLKYSAKRYSNFRPYVIAGVNFRSSLTADAKESTGAYLDLTRYEPFAEVGFGFDNYFYFFKLSVELKFSTGFQNVLANRRALEGYEPYLNAVDKMNSQIFQLSLHFE